MIVYGAETMGMLTRDSNQFLEDRGVFDEKSKQFFLKNFDHF
jgi:hypothetical protein